MASPQLEGGFTRIANELLEALARTRLSPYETSILLILIRKTYGWHKKQDFIVLRYIALLTGIAKPNVCRTLNKLERRGLIVRDKGMVGIQKDWTKWRDRKLSTEITSVISGDNDRYLRRDPIKKLYKRNLNKEIDTTPPEGVLIEESTFMPHHRMPIREEEKE